MWIRTEKKLLNSSHITRIEIQTADEARTYPDGFGTVTHDQAPDSGWVVLAFTRRERFWLSDGLATREEALELLDALAQALEARRSLLDLGNLAPPVHPFPKRS